MESFATGLKRIYEAYSATGVKVEFLTEEYGFTVRFHRHCGDGWRPNVVQENVQSANGTLNGTLNDTLNGTLKPDKADKDRLKELILQNPKITRKQMADVLGMSISSVQRLLNEMEEVHFTGGGRSGHWKMD